MINILKFIFGLVGGIFEGVFAFLHSLFSQERKTEYDASFIPATDVLSKRNKGFCLDGVRCLSTDLSFNHCLIIGSSSAGKSSRILVPSILRMMGDSSLVINDPSGELYALCSGPLYDWGYDVKVLAFNNPSISQGYSPLYRASTVSDLQKISKAIVVNTLGVGGKDPFWNLASENLITLMCRVVMHQRAEFQNLANVRHLINAFSHSPESIDKLIIAANDPGLLAEYKAVISQGEKTMQSVVATTRAALNIFGDPSVATVTAQDTIRFDEFRQRPTALFLQNSVPDMRYYAVLSSIFFEQFWGHLMRSPVSKHERPIFFLLDESSSLYMPGLQIAISNLRKSRCGCMIVLQALSQLTDLYGAAQAKSIAASCYSKVFMPPIQQDVAKEISGMLGSFEYTDEKEARHVRLLMTPDEIRELQTESIIFTGANRAIKAKTTPYFEQRKLRGLTEQRSYQPESTISAYPPPFIPLD